MVKMESCTGATDGGQCSCRNEQNSNLDTLYETLNELNIDAVSGMWPSIILGGKTVPAPSVNLYGIVLHTSHTKICIFFSLSSNGNTFMCVWNGWASKWYKFTGTVLS